MKFQIITMANDRSMASAEYDSLEAVLAAGLKQNGVSPDYSAKLAANPKAWVPREMLWNQPTFLGFAGPMYGESYTNGEAVLRYEQWKAYDILST